MIAPNASTSTGLGLGVSFALGISVGIAVGERRANQIGLCGFGSRPGKVLIYKKEPTGKSLAWPRGLQFHLY